MWRVLLLRQATVKLIWKAWVPFREFPLWKVLRRWSFSLAIGARKSFSRLYLSRYPILGRFLSQFEAPIGRGETLGPGALRCIGGGGGRGREGEGRRGWRQA